MTIFSDKNQAVFFRNEFRKAREVALKDAEGYQEILFSIERFGAFLSNNSIGNLGEFRNNIKDFVNESSIANNSDIWHSSFDTLYNLVNWARNDALHQGAVARHLTDSALKLTLILEEALENMANLMFVKDYMVRNPICATIWQPLSFVRQQMLINSFSYLPYIDDDKKWYLISDYNLASYLKGSCDCGKTSRCKCRRIRFSQSLKDALEHGLTSEKARKVYYENNIEEVLKKYKGKPILVFDQRNLKGSLLGIITPYDIL